MDGIVSAMLGPGTASGLLWQLNPRLAIPTHDQDNLGLVKAFVKGLPTQRVATTRHIGQSPRAATTEIILLKRRGGKGLNGFRT